MRRVDALAVGAMRAHNGFEHAGGQIGAFDAVSTVMGSPTSEVAFEFAWLRRQVQLEAVAPVRLAAPRSVVHEAVCIARPHRIGRLGETIRARAWQIRVLWMNR